MPRKKLNIIEIIHCYHRLLRYCFRSEPDTVSFIREFVKSGDVSIDVGAHKGVITHLLSKTVGPQGLVVAFEPQPEFLPWLTRMKNSLKLSNVEFVPLALSNETRKSSLFREAAGETGSMSPEYQNIGDSVAVDAITLDEYCEKNSLGRIDSMKIDVDGYEINVLKGAEKVLKRYQPVLIVEVLDKNLEVVSDYLKRLNYKKPVFEFRGRRYPGHRSGEVAHRQKDVLYRNFLFLPNS